MSFDHILASPAFWAAFALASELIGLNPKMKANSVVQFVFNAVAKLKPRP